MSFSQVENINEIYGNQIERIHCPVQRNGNRKKEPFSVDRDSCTHANQVTDDGSFLFRFVFFFSRWNRQIDGERKMPFAK